ncbi:tumor suppressor candidate 3-like isoform X2 [Gordionus sp. m RMFG-2023]|uniref:tumor suppressor candidate 3-like isoform X2 n=1 Tax=Gordionus sp. m RMFG-2023 TaxID=3053472 RepID=UPI0031FC0AAF
MMPHMLDFFSFLIIFLYIPHLSSFKYEISLGEKCRRLYEMSFKDAIIPFNNIKFQQYVEIGARNYTVMVMFTALTKRNCPICRPVYEEYTILANSWRLSNSLSNALFFTMIDHEDGYEIFNSFNIDSVPTFYLFPPKGKKKYYEVFDIQTEGISAEKLAKFIYTHIEIQINILRQPSYSGTVALILLCFLIGGLLYLRRNNLNFLYQSNLWASISLFFIFIMISGQMWNHIRGPPFMHRNPRTGGVNYIRHDGRAQFIVESYIVIILYAAITLGIILLKEAMCSTKLDNSKRKRLSI